MRIAVALYSRFRLLIHEVTKFGIIGLINLVVTWGGTNLLHFVLQIGPLTSNIIATVVATTLAYAGNRYWTFRHRADSGIGREYFLFFVLNGVGLLIQVMCIGFTEYTLKLDDHFSYNVALAIGITLGTLFRFWSYKKWVFLPPQSPVVDARTGLPSPAEVNAPDSLRGTFAGLLRSNTGRSNTGRSNTGRSNTGRSNTGRSNTGRSNTGRSNTGRSNTGRGSAVAGATAEHNGRPGARPAASLRGHGRIGGTDGSRDG